MGKWADLPLDLMECVDNYLNVVEKVIIRVTCTSWNSYLPAVPKLISEELPWLLLNDGRKGASLYSVHEGKRYPLYLPDLKHKIFKGSSYGWVITVEDEGSSNFDEISAFNPLTRVQIKLPPRSSFPDIIDINPRRVGEEYFMRNTDHGEPVERVLEIEPEEQDLEPVPVPVPGQDDAGYFVSNRITNQMHLNKVVLSSSPNNHNCVAVAIYGENCQLAWCKPHHKQWTSFVEFKGKGPHTGVWDVTFHNGKLYALYDTNKVEIYDMIGPNVTVPQIVISDIEDPPSEMTTPCNLVVCPNLGIIVASQEVDCVEEDGVDVVDTSWIQLFQLVE